MSACQHASQATVCEPHFSHHYLRGVLAIVINLRTTRYFESIETSILVIDADIQEVDQ